MFQVFNYYTRFQGLRANVTGLPAWARFILAMIALPFALLAGLSILAFLVSLLALLLLTAPVYRLLTYLTGAGTPNPAQQGFETTTTMPPPMGEPSPPRRHIEVTIIE